MSRKKPLENSAQPSSIDGSITSNKIQMTQSGGDLTAIQCDKSDDQPQGNTASEVVELLERLKSAAKASDLSETDPDQENYLKRATRKAGKEHGRDRSLHRELLDYFAEM